MSAGRNALLSALLGCALCAPLAAPAQELGRLFLTPQQRQDLDRRRAANIQEALIVQESTLTVEGRVSRSSGKTTTWINRSPQHDSQTNPDPTRVTLPGSEGQSEVTLKVGQTHDNVRLEVRDGLEGGKITVKKSRGSPR